MRWLKFSLSLILTLLLIFILNRSADPVTFAPGAFLDPFHGFWQNASPESASHAETLTLDGLSAPGEVVVDERGVPHIFADNIPDLAFLQGYVTARDRLWQMEFQTHAASGRLSEIIGRGPNDVVLNLDRGMRRMGMVWAAKRALIETNRNPESKAFNDAYSKGVNAYISSLKPQDYPLEYKLLDYQPEEWTPLKSALLSKYMAFDLSGRPDDLEHNNALKKWGKETYDLLYPEWPYAEDPIIPIQTRYRYPRRFRPQAPEAYHPDSLFAVNSVIGNPNINIGSNNWAVHGSKTQTGKPLLANDPHLGLNLPSIWYEVQLQGGGLNVYGVSLPGSPGVIIGFNDSIAWGVTNAGRDVLDYYRIQFRDETKELYNYHGSWRPVETRIDSYRVKGAGLFLDTVHYTAIGPIMYDENFGESPVPLAVRWMAHDPTDPIRGFFDLNKANNYEEYRQAIQHHVCPAQNFVFASTSGDVAITQQGRFIAKWPGQGRFVLDASDSTHVWQDTIPFEHNPSTLNPPQGFVSSANQHPTSRYYPYYYNGRFQVYRNRRLNQLLSSKDSMTVQDMMDFQQDDYSLYAAEILPLLLSELDEASLSSQEIRALQSLKTWNDYHYDKNSIAPSIFQTWWDQLVSDIWDDEFKESSLSLDRPSLSTTISLLRDSAEFRFFDNPHTPVRENRKMLANASFSKAIETLYAFNPDPDEWDWGKFKGTRVRHLAKVLKPFDREVLISGHSSILNAASKTHGPSWRMVVSMTQPIEAYGVYPGGQSGHVGEPGYDQFVEEWAAGEYFKLWFMKSPADKNGSMSYRQMMLVGN